MKERIQKILANAGVDSRRHIEEMILQGRVAVNGKVMTRLPILIDPEVDRITVDDEPIKLRGKGSKAEPRVYILMNKPTGVYATNVAQGEQRRAIDLLPGDFPYRVYPVGRLDHDSRGLLLLTNDGELTNKLTHPRYEIPKTYQAIVDGSVNPVMLEKLQKGIWLATREGEGFKTAPARIKVVHRGARQSVLELTLKEGRNRQVRRMLAKLGNKVRDLMRVKMGPLTLSGIGVGKFRPLTPREVRELHQWAERASQKSEEQKASGKPVPGMRPRPQRSKIKRPARENPPSNVEFSESFDESLDEQ